jgi:hypothetical protein
MNKTDVNTNDATRTTKSQKKLMLGVIMLGMAAMIGGLLWAGDKSAGLPDLLGTQRALPPGALHVEDVAAESTSESMGVVSVFHGTESLE